jgi:ABC-type Mn2+/Zn2+ transport system permease subunit
VRDEPRRVLKVPIWFALLAVVIGLIASRTTGILVGGLIIALSIFGWGLVAILRAKRSGQPP